MTLRRILERHGPIHQPQRGHRAPAGCQGPEARAGPDLLLPGPRDPGHGGSGVPPVVQAGQRQQCRAQDKSETHYTSGQINITSNSDQKVIRVAPDTRAISDHKDTQSPGLGRLAAVCPGWGPPPM